MRGTDFAKLQTPNLILVTPYTYWKENWGTFSNTTHPGSYLRPRPPHKDAQSDITDSPGGFNTRSPGASTYSGVARGVRWVWPAPGTTFPSFLMGRQHFFYVDDDCREGNQTQGSQGPLRATKNSSYASISTILHVFGDPITPQV